MGKRRGDRIGRGHGTARVATRVAAAVACCVLIGPAGLAQPARDAPPTLAGWMPSMVACVIGASVVQAGVIGLLLISMARRRRVEAKLAASEAKYRQIVETADEGIWMVDTEWKTTFANARMGEMLGVAPAAMLGRHLCEFMDEEARQGCEKNMRRREEGVREQHDFRFRRSDGTDLWAIVSTNPTTDGRGRFSGALAMVADVTKRHEAERAARESERAFRSTFEHAAVGISNVGVDGRWLMMNDRMCQMLGYSRAELMARTFEDVTHPEDVETNRRLLHAAIEGAGDTYSLEKRYVRKDGSILWALVTASMVRDERGEPSYFISVIQDITNRKRAEVELAQSRRVLEMIATGAAVGSTIDAIVRMIQEQASPAIGSVVRLDEQGRIRTVGAPGLPAAYLGAIEGLGIGAGVGSCGTAMHEKRRVVVEDIATDPLWAIYKDVALEHGLRACWSEPILATDGSVLGSLAMYFKEKRGPTARDLEMISTAAHLAGIAMERAKTEEARERSEATNRALLAANPDMMFRMDRAGRYVGYHALDLARLAVPPERFMGRTAEEVLPAERAAECRKYLEALFATGLPQMYEYEVTRQEGRRGWWEVRMVRGMEEEALLLLRDVTDRVLAERRVRESEERLRLLVENTPLGVVHWDMDFRVTGWNPGAEKVFGYTAAEARQKHASFIIPEPSRRYVSDLWRELVSNKGGHRGTNQNVRKDGMLVYCEWYNCPLVDSGGKVIGVASVVEDVTERRLAQQRQDFVMAELDHRVKNNLAAVISLAEQTGRSSRAFPEFLEAFMGRVRAMSRMHSALARSRWHGADLRMLVMQTLEAFGSGSAGRARVDGESVLLGPRAAQAMAMALNELATNAVKYGALSSASGTVEVAWQVAVEEGARQLSVRWEERGGPPVREPEQRGFGSQLIEGTIAYELRGTALTDYAITGVVCSMIVPLIEEIGPSSEEPGMDGPGAL